MKKLFLTLALVAAGSLAYGQGTIAFPNSALTKVTMTPTGGSAAAVGLTAGLVNYGVFFGTTSASLSLVPTLGVNSTANAGIINAAQVFAIPGTAEKDVVYMQIKGWTGSFGSDWQTASTTGGAYFGQTDVRQVTLGPTAGPGAVIWQTASGTSANKFTPLNLNQVPIVPEPSTMALAGLGAAALLIFRRRK